MAKKFRVDPSNPKRICLSLTVQDDLQKKGFVPCPEVSKAKDALTLEEADRLPCHGARVTTPNEVPKKRMDHVCHPHWEGEALEPKAFHALLNRVYQLRPSCQGQEGIIPYIKKA